ncbi:MAG: hypothetical protein U0521_29520 [Anaerolineae bacterium]
MSVDAKTVFDNAAADYDRLRRQLVPHFDDFYGAVAGTYSVPARRCLSRPRPRRGHGLLRRWGRRSIP